MAVLADLVLKIRRRVHDADLTSDERPHYKDIYYEEALDRGLSRLNLNLGTSYSIPTLIAKYEYAKVKGVWLPKKVERIDPLSGVDKIPIENLKVNEGIEDSEFSRW